MTKMKHTTYKISGHSDARTSRLHGETYETYEAALKDLENVLGDNLIEYEVDAGNEQAWLIYTSQEACDDDNDGSRVVASIETVTETIEMV